MSALELFTIVFWSIVWLFLIVWFIRIMWVHHVRMKLMAEDWEAYLRLEPWDTMRNRFWVWDVRKFIK